VTMLAAIAEFERELIRERIELSPLRLDARQQLFEVHVLRPSIVGLSSFAQPDLLVKVWRSHGRACKGSQTRWPTAE
jgi:hypothetical protein